MKMVFDRFVKLPRNTILAGDFVFFQTKLQVCKGLDLPNFTKFDHNSNDFGLSFAKQKLKKIAQNHHFLQNFIIFDRSRFSTTKYKLHRKIYHWNFTNKCFLPVIEEFRSWIISIFIGQSSQMAAKNSFFIVGMILKKK